MTARNALTNLLLACWAAALLAGMHQLSGCQSPPAADPPPSQPSPRPLPRPQQELLSLHNVARRSRGIPALSEDSRLTAAAQGHADWMARTGRMDHTGEGGSSFSDRVRKAGYQGRGGGENVAAGHRTAPQAMESWLGSSGHAANILAPRYEHIGLGVAQAKGGRLYWCVVFAYGGRQPGAAWQGTADALPPPLPDLSEPYFLRRPSHPEAANE